MVELRDDILQELIEIQDAMNNAPIVTVDIEVGHCSPKDHDTHVTKVSSQNITHLLDGILTRMLRDTDDIDDYDKALVKSVDHLIRYGLIIGAGEILYITVNKNGDCHYDEYVRYRESLLAEHGDAFDLMYVEHARNHAWKNDRISIDAYKTANEISQLAKKHGLSFDDMIKAITDSHVIFSKFILS